MERPATRERRRRQAVKGTILRLATLAVLVGVVGTAYAQASDNNTIMHDAQYSWGDNTLILNFAGKINQFMVDMNKISIADGPCAIRLTWEEYGMASQDRMSFSIELSEAHRGELAKMGAPTIVTQEGAFATRGDSSLLAPSSIPLAVTGNATNNSTAPCVITYGFNDALLRVYARNYTETLQAIHGGFDVWVELNPDLQFAMVKTDPVIQINWVEFNPDHIGLACVDCIGYGSYMDVTLYSYNCRGERVYYTPDSIRNVVAHELGHNLGLGHHQDENHLMYGKDWSRYYPFQNMSYAIPESSAVEFIGEDDLTNREAELETELGNLKAKTDELGARMERYVERYSTDRSGGVIYFDTDREVNEYRAMVALFNKMAGEYNEMVGEYNTTVGELNCLRTTPSDQNSVATGQH